ARFGDTEHFAILERALARGKSGQTGNFGHKRSSYWGEETNMAPSSSEPAIRFSNPPELAPPPGYSNVVEISGGRMIFVAGQTAIDAAGNLVGKSDFAAQADQVFANLAAALASVGCTARY